MAEEIIDLTSGLYRFLVAGEATVLAGKRAAEEARARYLERASQLSRRFQEARHNAGERLSVRLDEISASLGRVAAELDARRTRTGTLTETWKGLGKQYEALLHHVRKRRLVVPAGVCLEHIKPRNYSRNLFHVCVGLVSISAYELLLSRAAMIAVGASALGLFIFMDILRRRSAFWNEQFVQRVFGVISRPGEAYRIPSATWYTAALLVGAIFLPQHAVELGALVLALGDPVASLVGKRWGTRKLLGQKSWVGSGAFVVVSFVAATTFLWLVVPGVGLARAVTIATVLSLLGALTELLSRRVDDNFSIPLAVGLMATLLL
jgi:dolichol kinase